MQAASEVAYNRADELHSAESFHSMSIDIVIPDRVVYVPLIRVDGRCLLENSTKTHSLFVFLRSKSIVIAPTAHRQNPLQIPLKATWRPTLNLSPLRMGVQQLKDVIEKEVSAVVAHQPETKIFILRVITF